MVNGLDWQGYLAGSSKTARTILIFSIAVNHSFEVKNIEIWAPAFFKHNNLSIATVTYVNLQDRKERVQIPDVVVSWLLVELRRTYADRRKYRSRRSSRVRFKASRRSDLICSSTAFD